MLFIHNNIGALGGVGCPPRTGYLYVFYILRFIFTWTIHILLFTLSIYISSIFTCIHISNGNESFPFYGNLFFSLSQTRPVLDYINIFALFVSLLYHVHNVSLVFGYLCFHSITFVIGRWINSVKWRYSLKPIVKDDTCDVGWRDYLQTIISVS